MQEILALTPAELIASKILAWESRRGNPKAGTDWRDLAELLLTFPELKTESGRVADCLRGGEAPESALAAWRDFVSQDIVKEDEDAGY